MIIGVGTDIIEIARIEKAIQNSSFFTRFFTENERKYIEKAQKSLQPEKAAGIFCAKEACAKAVGTGFFKLPPNTIEITHDIYGKPLAKVARQRSVEFFLSISHSREYATAFAIAIKTLEEAQK